MDKNEYISYKSNKVKTNYYRALKYGVVYADFILEDVANAILKENKVTWIFSKSKRVN